MLKYVLQLLTQGRAIEQAVREHTEQARAIERAILDQTTEIRALRAALDDHHSFLELPIGSAAEAFRDLRTTIVALRTDVAELRTPVRASLARRIDKDHIN